MQTPYFNDPQSILFEFNKFATEMVVNSDGTRHAQFSFCVHIANAKYLCWDKIKLVVTYLWILLLVVIALKAFTARMHSSRMRTDRFGCHHYMSLPVQRVDPQVNKVEQVSSDDHQMSVETGGRVVQRGMSGEVYVPGRGLPCDLSHDTFDVTYPTLNRMTDRCLWKHYLPVTTVVDGKTVLW